MTWLSTDEKAPSPAQFPSGLGLIFVPISFGEFIDKVTILEIKAERMADEKKLASVSSELDRLRKAAGDLEDLLPRISELKNELRRINETLWEIEDRIRDCETEKGLRPRLC